MSETTHEDNEQNETKTKGNKLASKLSLAGKIAGALVILGGFIAKVTILPNIETNDLLKIGFSIMGVFGTIDINIALDKVFNK